MSLQCISLYVFAATDKVVNLGQIMELGGGRNGGKAISLIYISFWRLANFFMWPIVGTNICGKCIIQPFTAV